MDLVIGIGNTLRGDDGLASVLVNQRTWDDDCRSLVVQQLTPELSDLLKDVDRVLFADASIDSREVRLERIASAEARGIGHAISPASLLAWTQRLFERVPEAWLLAIPGQSFEIGAPIGPVARGFLSEAGRRLDAWRSRSPLPRVVVGE